MSTAIHASMEQLYMPPTSVHGREKDCTKGTGLSGPTRFVDEVIAMHDCVWSLHGDDARASTALHHETTARRRAALMHHARAW